MKYPGTELELFRHAANWKRRWATAVRPFVQGHVLEVGCGLGANAHHVCHDRVLSYTFLEPDAHLLAQVPEHAHLPPTIAQRSVQGTSRDMAGERFDAVLYIDVLEHIEDDTAELQRAYDMLNPGGHLIILVPAFQFLYSPFDEAIGHHRRYDRPLLRARMPAGLMIHRLRYLDSAGFLLSLGNKLMLRSAAPTRAQVLFWDRWIVPLSRITDPLVAHAFGRSLLAVAQKP